MGDISKPPISAVSAISATLFSQTRVLQVFPKVLHRDVKGVKGDVSKDGIVLMLVYI